MSQRLELRAIARDSGFNLARQIVGLVLGVAISVMLARGLGTEDRGIYALVVLLPTLIATFLNTGVAPSTVYHLGRNDYELVATARGNIALALWLSSLGIVVGVLVIFGAADFLFPEVPTEYLLFGLLLIPTSFYNSYLLAIFQGLQDFRTFNLVSLVPQVVIVIAIGVLIFWMDLGVPGAVLANLMGSLSVLGLLLLLLSRRCKPSSIFAFWVDFGYSKRVLTYGMKAHLSNIVAFLNYRADMFLLGLWVGVVPVGIYSVAVGLAERLWLVSSSVSTVMLPKIASLQDREEDRLVLTPLVARHVLWLSIAMGIVIALFAPWAVVLLYSDAYRESATVLRWLLPGIVLMSANKILANDIAGRGRPEVNSRQSTVALFINLGANAVLIPQWGAVGAAIATTISYTFLSVAKLVVYCRMTGALWTNVVFLTKGDLVRSVSVIRNMATRY